MKSYSFHLHQIEQLQLVLLTRAVIQKKEENALPFL